MKKQSIAYATLREGKDVVACWPTEPRPVDWFVQIVKAESRKHPASPVRIDTLKAEHEQTTAALNKLGAGWRLVTAAHIRHALRGEGVQRTAFYGPQCPFPEPVQSVDVKPKKGETVQAATRRTVEALRRKHGPDAHIEQGQRRRKGDRFPSVPFCAAWLAADWIQQHLGQFTATEIVHGLRENTGLAQHYEPLAAKGRAAQKRGREHMQRMNESKVEKAKRLKEFIGQKYRAMEPEIRDKTLRVKEAYDRIQDAVEACFNNPDRPGEGYRPSPSTIDRALGKKDTKKRKKK